ncbi:MAG: hypothetical protein JXA79_04365, partial [Deltaproteobacteria bacterium]|nr:hypothetical protein [Deltaproteobacteria bacterium]
MAIAPKHVCPAFNPPDIKALLCALGDFVVQSLPFFLYGSVCEARVYPRPINGTQISTDIHRFLFYLYPYT